MQQDNILILVQPTYCIDGGMEARGHQPKEQNDGKTDKQTKQSLD